MAKVILGNHKPNKFRKQKRKLPNASRILSVYKPLFPQFTISQNPQIQPKRTLNLSISTIATETTESSKKILLKSFDDEDFKVDKIIALESKTIKHMIEDDCTDNVIPLPNVTGKILAKVIEYCKKHVESSEKKKDSSDTTTAGFGGGVGGGGGGIVDDELKSWDAEFVNVD
ncbi:hypothetical protein RND81_02G141100 [Saponaria officinalis]|uniref:SKP1 component POZ domain-containing protein n=1 Tax=Saponaria officinalis TaxID=3572 RepID=A0AAW1MQ09_SAPOF